MGEQEGFEPRAPRIHPDWLPGPLGPAASLALGPRQQIRAANPCPRKPWGRSTAQSCVWLWVLPAHPFGPQGEAGSRARFRQVSVRGAQTEAPLRRTLSLSRQALRAVGSAPGPGPQPAGRVLWDWEITARKARGSPAPPLPIPESLRSRPAHPAPPARPGRGCQATAGCWGGAGRGGTAPSRGAALAGLDFASAPAPPRLSERPGREQKAEQ